MRSALLLALPVAAFAAALAVFERLATGRWSALPAYTLAAFAVTVTLARLLPWRALARRIEPQSRLFPAVLFLLLIRHFAGVLGREALRVFQARSLCVTRRYGPGWFRSLTWTAVAVLERALVRAERFYAALALRGFAE
jgi:hypothetical protein